jgi:hypothetical protein
MVLIGVDVSPLFSRQLKVSIVFDASHPPLVILLPTCPEKNTELVDIKFDGFSFDSSRD